jgi:hypothetical protein
MKITDLSYKQEYLQGSAGTRKNGYRDQTLLLP